MEKAQRIDFLYHQFLSGNSSAEELWELFEHFKVADKEQLLALIQETDDDEEDLPHPLKQQQLFQEIENRIDKNSRKAAIVRLLATTAAIAAMILLATGLYFWRSAEVPLKTVYAAYGKTVSFRLPDGSKIWLNAGTTLQYPEKFAAKDRQVSLVNGDAFFDIVHDDRKPFIVHLKGSTVNVLGTSFEIAAFEKENDTRITVQTGKVGVIQPDKKAAFLLPGERTVINHRTHIMQKVKVSEDDVAAWRTGRLIFVNQPLGEVMQTLERAYNIHITVANSRLLNEKVTMRLNYHPAINNVLTAISFSNHFTFKKLNEQSVIVQ